ncbi:TPA: ABC transporter permease, partial [Streptococcus suis]
MINWALYKREMRKSIKLLVIFAAIITLYVSIIIGMYDPEMMATLDTFYQIMPDLMASVGMTAGATTLIGFMISYLYGFILLLFPLLFIVLRANGLIAKYVDTGSIVALLAAPVKRRVMALTQMGVLLSGIVLLDLYTTGLEIALATWQFPGQMPVGELMRLNGGLLCLHLLIGGIAFLSSAYFSDTKYSLAFGAGIPGLMFVLQMLANAGHEARAAKYFTIFSLFQAQGLVASQTEALLGAGTLAIGAILFYAIAVAVFSN